MFSTNTNSSFISNNAYFNNGWKRIGVGNNGNGNGRGSKLLLQNNGNFTFYSFGPGDSNSLINDQTTLLNILYDGKVLIGTGVLHQKGTGGYFSTNEYKLFVETGILTEKVKVATVGSAHWADYVFEDDYCLNTIEDVAEFVEANNHLPNVPSAKDVEENGIEMVQMDATLLRQVEELWLHTIELNEDNKDLQIENTTLNIEVENLQDQNQDLTQEVQEIQDQNQELNEKVDNLNVQYQQLLKMIQELTEAAQK